MREVFALLSVILFWGYQTSNIELSFIIAAFLTFPILSDTKLKFTFPFFKFSVLITGFLLSVVVFYYINSNNMFFLTGVLKWLPLILLPIIGLELYNEDRKTPLKAFFIFSNDEGLRVKTLIYYIFITVMASSSKVDVFYYVFVTCFIVVLLINIKAKRFNKTSFGIIIIILLVLSAGVQVQVSSLHKNAVASIISFLMGGNDIDITKSSTRIGKIGELKMSNKIIYRMLADKNKYPHYLRDATYIKYFDGDWVAPKSKFTKVKNSICPNVKIKKDSKILTAVLLGSFEKKANIPLPTKTIITEKQSNDEVYTKNDLMVINRSGDETDYIKFKYHENRVSCDKKMTNDDLEVPKSEVKFIREFIKKHNLSSETPRLETFKKLVSIFNNKFRYTLNLKKKKGNVSDLGFFLLDSQEGHCEYFATATTLILRELGIPARYNVGYSVQEYSHWSKNFIIRQNHSHAWVRVLYNGNWHNLDTTPPDWNAIENQGSFIFRSISDFLSYIGYKITYSSFWKFMKNNLELLIPFLVIIFLGIRYKNRKKIKSIKEKKKIKSKFLKKVDKYLKKKQVVRDETIPIKTWMESLDNEDKEKIKYYDLLEIISQYHIYRFSGQDLPKTRLKSIYKEIKTLNKTKN